MLNYLKSSPLMKKTAAYYIAALFIVYFYIFVWYFIVSVAARGPEYRTNSAIFMCLFPILNYVGYGMYLNLLYDNVYDNYKKRLIRGLTKHLFIIYLFFILVGTIFALSTKESPFGFLVNDTECIVFSLASAFILLSIPSFVLYKGKEKFKKAFHNTITPILRFIVNCIFVMFLFVVFHYFNQPV